MCSCSHAPSTGQGPATAKANCRHDTIRCQRQRGPPFSAVGTLKTCSKSISKDHHPLPMWHAFPHKAFIPAGRRPDSDDGFPTIIIALIFSVMI